MQALQSQINNFFSVYQSLGKNIFEYFIGDRVSWSVSVDVAFYLMLGCFGRQAHGFDSTSLFSGDVGLSLQLCFGGIVGLNPHFCGVGIFYFIWFWWWCFYFDFL